MSPKKFETNAVRTQVARSKHDEHSVPLFLTSSFVFDDAEEMRASFAEEKQRNIHSRFTNPNTNEFVEKICQVGIDWCIAQSKELIAAGVPFLHYYSMGKSDNIHKVASAVF